METGWQYKVNITSRELTCSFYSLIKEPMPRPSFTFLSWNLCLLEPSAEAPANWRIDLTESKVREFVLDLQPDFVFFQELPAMVPYVEDYDLIPSNTTSHSGTIATIAKKELMDDLKSKSIGRFGVITVVESARLTFANVHVEPGRDGDFKRLEMLRTISNTSPTCALAIIGDTNMRVSEEDSMKPLGLFGERPPSPTWNTKRNKYRDKGSAFTSYFTRYFHSDVVEIDNVEVHDDPIEHEGDKLFLSDHFALSGRVTVLPEEEATEKRAAAAKQAQPDDAN